MTKGKIKELGFDSVSHEMPWYHDNMHGQIEHNCKNIPKVEKVLFLLIEWI